ncbi:MAG: hypothetical protein Q4B80_02340 [Aerococcaceae bacterium]|nr:hypothetical protein [Aerococcaceae bacterium]
MNRKTVSILTTILLIVLLGFSWLYWRSQTYMGQAEVEAVQRVEYDYPVKKVNRFYWTTIKQAYFSLDFVDENDQRRYAIIARNGGEAVYFTAEELISEEDAQAITVSDLKPHKILHTRLGLMEAIPVWEVALKNENGTLTYYYLNAINGEWIQKIENI